MALLDITILLPFFFVLAIVYGALDVANVLKNKGVKAIIAIILAFFAISSPDVTELITGILPYAALFFIGFFFVGFLLSLFKEEKGKEKDYVLGGIIIALVLVFISSQEHLEIIDIQDQNFLALIVLLIIVMLLYAGYRMKEK